MSMRLSGRTFDYSLYCDVPGCTRRLTTLTNRPEEAVREARTRGWVVGVRDCVCPSCASEIVAGSVKIKEAAHA